MSAGKSHQMAVYGALTPESEGWRRPGRSGSEPLVFLAVDASDRESSDTADVMYRMGQHLHLHHRVRMNFVALRNLDGPEQSKREVGQLITADAVIWTASSRAFGAATRIQGFIKEAEKAHDQSVPVLAGKVAAAVVTEARHNSDAVSDRLLKTAMLYEMDIAGWAMATRGPDPMEQITKLLDQMVKQVQTNAANSEQPDPATSLRKVKETRE